MKTEIKLTTTLDDLKQHEAQFGLGITGAIKKLDFEVSQIVTVMSRLRKPFLNKLHTAQEAKDYALKLEQYDLDYQKYKENINVQDQLIFQSNKLLEQFIKDKASFHLVPEKYQAKVYDKAYEMGHSNGWTEIYNCLADLVDIFC